MKQEETYTELTKEILERKKDNITFLFESKSRSIIKTFEELMERIYCRSNDTVMTFTNPILVLDNKYHFIIDEIKYKKISEKNIFGKTKTVYTDELDYNEIIFINRDLELFISGDIVKTLLLEYLDKKAEEYVLILEEKNKQREEKINKDKEYKKYLLNLKEKEE